MNYLNPTYNATSAAKRRPPHTGFIIGSRRRRLLRHAPPILPVLCATPDAAKENADKANVRYYTACVRRTWDQASMAAKTAAEALANFDPKAFLATASRGRTVSKYRKGDAVFLQEGTADAVFYVQKGKIKITVESKQGKEAVIAILGPGEFFGEGCLIGQPLRLATARTMTESEVTRVSKAEMVRVLHEEPSFGELFTAYLLTRNNRIEEDLVDQLFNSSEKRLARTLLLLANFGKDGGPQPITIPMGQETLAEIIGTTRPRVSHFMNKFRKLGFISYNGHLRIHSSLVSVVLRD
jgi:CRP/FNR family cyclic AMP-dependent transcriptional regulator